MMEARVIRSIDALQALQPEWDALAAPAGSPMFEHDWFASCAVAFHRESDLRVIAVHRRGTLVAVAPLARERVLFAGRLVLLGASKLYEPGGWVYASTDALAAVMSAVAELCRPLLLHRVPADSDLPASLCSAFPAGFTVTRSSAPSVAVEIRSTWEEYYGGLSARTRRNLEMSWHFAKRELGDLQIDHLHPRPTDVPGILEKFLNIETAGWKGRRGSAIAQRPDLRIFFERYCTRSAEQGRLRVTQLRVHSRIVALELSVAAHDRIWALKIAYDEAVAKHMPGMHVVHASVRHAFDSGLKAYEFLGSAEPWQRRWKPVARRYVVVAHYPATLVGALVGVRDAMTATWSRAWRRALLPRARR